MTLQDLPIRRKIMAVIMLTSVTVLLLTVLAFMAYDLVTFRGAMAQNLTVMARIVANNSTAALAFKDDQDATETLSSLAAEQQVTLAALYDSEGKIFVTYPPNSPEELFPPIPRNLQPRFERAELIIFEPVTRDGVQVGMLCLKADLRLFYRRVQTYAALSALIMVCSLAVAIGLSQRLQKHISQPVMALADTARIISERRDFSVRAPKLSGDELGLLTDAFNQMLTRIQEQTVALQENEARLRLTLEASRIGTWAWNFKDQQITWDDYNAALFGLKPGEFDGTYAAFEKLTHPEDREAVKEAATRAIQQNEEFSFEFRVVWPDATVHNLFGRGKALYDADGKPLRMNGVTLDITERKRSEEASRFLASIVQSTDDAIVGKDLEGLVVSWNAGAERMFGYTAEEMIGQTVERLTAPERPDEEARILQEVKSGQTRQYETVRICKDGRRLDVSLTVSPIRDAKGAIVGLSSISRDITARKRIESELKESRARLSGIIGSAMDAIISVDATQHITLFNEAAEKMFRYKTEEALGKPLDLFIPPRFREAHRHHVQEFGQTGSTARAMGHLRPLAGLRTGGEEFPIEASISHIEVGGQQIYTVILRDITERLKAQESLERHARTLREQAQMLDLANVMARDLQDRVILWNTGMEKMYGWSRGEMLGHLSHKILQTQFPAPPEEIQATLLNQGHWEGELIHTRKDGKKIAVSSQWVLHKDEKGTPTAILEVNTDITERKLAEQQMLRMNFELEQRVQARTAELTAANQEMEAFTYSVAHDLRAPLRHIDAFSKILHDEFGSVLPPEATRYLETIRRGSQNMSHLVDDLLNLARVGRQELKHELTSLGALVEEVIAELARETKHRNIEWRVGKLPSVEGDPGLLKQVFINLLSNAVKYSRPRNKTVIEIGRKKIENETVIFVRDNGVGFNMKYSDKLFGVFQRLHRAEEFEGTGVGLAIVERVIRRHGGRIWAQSELDKGATFYFTLTGLDKASGPNPPGKHL